MSMAALIVKNLVRQRVRTLLTVVGITVGIATVVALGAIVGGLKSTAAQILHGFDSDFLVAQEGASDLSFSIVTEEEWRQVADRDDVEHAIGALFHISRAGSNPYFVTIGVEAASLPPEVIHLREGRLLAPGATDEVMLGSRAAGDLDADVGDTVTIEDRNFTVVGVYESDDLWSNSGALAPLRQVQEIAGKPGFVTAIFVKARSDVPSHEVAAGIERDFRTLTAVEDVGQYSEVDQGIEIMDALNLAISALAVGIGAIGVMNTMAMSVFERTREIGVLRAVGWSGQRIFRMIVGESLFLCLAATVLGSALGVAAARGVVTFPAVRSLLEPQYSPDIFLRAIVVALAVALAGAAYPVFRAVSLTPMEALRHE